MLHARPDYAHIQDPHGKIPTDEPVFLLRGCDVLAPLVVLSWVALAERAGADQTLIRDALAQAKRMYEWQAEHGSKVPDGPKAPEPESVTATISAEEADLLRELRARKAEAGRTPRVFVI